MTHTLGQKLLDKTAQHLIAKAERLETAAARLREAAGQLSGPTPSVVKPEREFVEESVAQDDPAESPPAGNSAAPPTLPPIRNRDGALTRFGQIAQFLQHVGPSRKTDIVAKSGVPEGSIRAILNFRNFHRTSDGRWRCYDHTPRVRGFS